jgi:mannose-6-phosphate isomerase-like protein (cupin superfamily)
MKIVEIARKTNLSSSLISQIENSKAQLSLLSLTKIANALEIPPGSFFEKQYPALNNDNMVQDESDFIVRKGRNKILSPNKGVKYFLLTPNMIGNIQFLYAIFKKHSKSAEKAYKHVGEECVYILKGNLQIELSGKKYDLKEGDSIFFNPQNPHRVINNSDEDAEAIWVNSPPWF